jgi:hypothetical protein
MIRPIVFLACSFLFISATVMNGKQGIAIHQPLIGFYVPDEDLSPQDRAEKNVETYVTTKFGAERAYKMYNFGQLYRLKKPEQKQLDELKELRALVPGMKDNYGNRIDSVIASYDTLIAQKEREIKQKNIVPDYIISHIFSIKNKTGGGGTVYEGDFILNDKFEVKDFRVKLGADLSKDDFEWFYYFFQQYPIFNSGDYEKDVNMSKQIFDFYNSHLSKLKTEKEEFLVTALRVTRIINKTKKYDKDVICGFLVMKKIDEKKYCENYHPLKFSPAEEILTKTNAGDSLIGYKIFHLFECTDSTGKAQQKAVYCELDPYFTPAGMLKVDPPYDKYFEKK